MRTVRAVVECVQVVPMDAKVGNPLTHQPMDSLHKKVPGLLRESLYHHTLDVSVWPECKPLSTLKWAVECGDTAGCMQHGATPCNKLSIACPGQCKPQQDKHCWDIRLPVMGMLGHFLLMVTNIVLGYTEALCTDGNIRLFKELNGCKQGHQDQRLGCGSSSRPRGSYQRVPNG